MGLLDECYVGFVNMDHRRDRLARMQRELDRVGLPATRHRGMKPEEYVGDPKRVEKMRNRTPGAIGCYFSQVGIMAKALALGKHAFVMEDDLVFCDDFFNRVDLMRQFVVDHDWDVIWLGGTVHINPPYWHKGLGRDAETTDHPNFLRAYGAFCTYAYLVNGESLDQVLQLLDETLDQTIGIDYSFIQFQPRILAYTFVPGCVTQYDNQSDIGKGVTRFSGFLKMNGTVENSAYVFQKRLSDFDPTKFNWHEAGERRSW